MMNKREIYERYGVRGLSLINMGYAPDWTPNIRETKQRRPRYITPAESLFQERFVCNSCQKTYYALKELVEHCPFCNAPQNYNPDEILKSLLK